MAQWGRNDTAVTANSSTTKETSNGAPMGTYALVKGDQINRVDGANAHFGNTSPGSRAGVDYNMFGNTTIGAFLPGVAKGVFAVNAYSMQNTTGGNVEIGIVTFGGSGYQANAAVTLTVTNGGSGATVNAHANTSTNPGRIDSLLISAVGSGYVTAPTVAIAAPAAINIPANTTTIPVPAANNITANTAGVVNNALLITSANTKWNVNDHLYYGVPASNTAIPGLTGNSYYYVAFANSTGIQLANSVGGAVLTLTPGTASSGETHTVTGDASFVKVTSANSYWQVGDRFYYGVPASNTAFGGLTGNSYYYVSFANTTGIKFASSATGANLTFGVTTIPTASSPETHTIKGDTATGYVDINAVYPQVTHAGWVLRTEGSGGRAGRVQYETLVAMGSIGVNATSSTGVTGPANTITSNTVDQYV
jgi:hypothetical protein